jgi:hypothetical protein
VASGILPATPFSALGAFVAGGLAAVTSAARMWAVNIIRKKQRIFFILNQVLASSVI